MTSDTGSIENVDRVAIVLYDGFDELDAIGPYEVLQNAASHVSLTVRLCTLESVEEIRASHGLRVVPDGVLGDLDESDFDLLVIPGGGWNDRSAAGARAEVEGGNLPDAIATHHESGALVASVCTGGMILEAAGILEGRRAITHQGAVEELRERGVDVVEARVVDDGDVLTAGGVTSGIDLALYLTERIAGAEVADAVSRKMEYERSGEVYRPDPNPERRA